MNKIEPESSLRIEGWNQFGEQRWFSLYHYLPHGHSQEIGWLTPVAGLRYQSCRAPGRINSRPSLSMARTGSHASRYHQFPDLAHIRHLSARQVGVQITQMVQQFIQGLALHSIVWEIREVTDP